MFKNADRRLLTILLIVFVGVMGGSMILPILPLYAEREFDMSPAVITMLGSSFFAAQFLAGPYLGRLSDRQGRLPVLILSQIGTVISFIMLVLAQNTAMLFAARILDGITGGNIIVAQAYVTDVTPGEKRTQALGYIFAMFGLGFIFGPALGGILSSAFGLRAPYIIAAIAAAVTVVITWLALDESVSPEQRAANRAYRQGGLNILEVLHNTPLVMILVVAFIGQFAFGMLQSTFALFGQDVLFAGAEEKVINLGVGLMLGMIGLGQFSTQMWLLPRLLKRFHERRLVILGNTVRGLSLFLFSVIVSPWLGAVGAVLFAMGQGTMMPPLQSLSTRTVDDELRGGVLGLYQSVISLGIIFSTFIAGSLYTLAPATPYALGAALSVVVLVPAFLLMRYEFAPRKRPAAAPMAAR